MFWLQLSTLVLINLLIVALIASSSTLRSPLFTRVQYVGADEGAYNVWDLIAQVEAERDAEREAEQDCLVERPYRPEPPRFPQFDPDEPTGRHHLRP
ncbi:hypothetical protein [Saccharopolyspora sp. ASAGF58]|uniref:hypothetical protein n=1 Tax=Saccharopolyspora sp. ASAGF58 TaxID=2719023 RepID=UPI0014402060|nr:hypothetical protein [Saccharopolyspora sp. ASAGF58]QIZ33717.1 hypothetical protein FDZ84_01945 [Saccharopolyspora sp. ASAGF58]